MRFSPTATADQIRTFVDLGYRVHWANRGYHVIRDSIGQYLIGFMPGTRHEHWIGLTHSDNTTLNGKPDDFFWEIT